MKELFITETMKKLQNQARAWYADGKKIDADAVQHGWNVAAGRIIVDEVVGATITVLGESQKYQYDVHITCPSKGMDRDAKLNINQIGNSILGNNATVYYSL